jgi:hypothetical protein
MLVVLVKDQDVLVLFPAPPAEPTCDFPVDLFGLREIGNPMRCCRSEATPTWRLTYARILMSPVQPRSKRPIFTVLASAIVLSAAAFLANLVWADAADASLDPASAGANQATIAKGPKLASSSLDPKVIMMETWQATNQSVASGSQSGSPGAPAASPPPAAPVNLKTKVDYYWEGYFFNYNYYYNFYSQFYFGDKQGYNFFFPYYYTFYYNYYFTLYYNYYSLLYKLT